MNIDVINAWQLVLKAGPMIWPILLLSVAATGITLNRIFFFKKAEALFTAQRVLLLGSLRQGDYHATLKLAEANPGLAAGIIKAGILNAAGSDEMIRISLEQAWEQERIPVDNFLPLLGMIVNLAPLMGLLGTVNAMTVVFHASVVRSNVLNPQSAGELASGIWQALLTTSAGLAVGIFGYAAFCFCCARASLFDAWVRRLLVETRAVLCSLKETQPLTRQGHDEVS